MNLEVNGTGIASKHANTVVNGNPRVVGQGKAVAAELLGDKGLVDGSTKPASSSRTGGDRNARQIGVVQLNDYVQSIQRNLEFRVDEATNRTVVSVIDRDSQEVIRQIPSEVILKLARQFIAMQERVGLLLEDQA